MPCRHPRSTTRNQGTALGIAGAGNSGTVLAALFAPGLAVAYGSGNVFGLVLIPLSLALLVYVFFAKDSPDCPPPKSLHQYLNVLKDKDAWWFMFLYFCTFGGFVGLASSLTIYFNDQYGLSPVEAGYFTAACVFAGSLVRPIGGALADRIGGIRTLLAMYMLAGGFLVLMSFGADSPWGALGLFILAMGSLGVGNGAVFQLVPQRFRKEIGGPGPQTATEKSDEKMVKEVAGKGGWGTITPPEKTAQVAPKKEENQYEKMWGGGKAEPTPVKAEPEMPMVDDDELPPCFGDFDPSAPDCSTKACEMSKGCQDYREARLEKRRQAKRLSR